MTNDEPNLGDSLPQGTSTPAEKARKYSDRRAASPDSLKSNDPLEHRSRLNRDSLLDMVDPHANEADSSYKPEKPVQEDMFGDLFKDEENPMGEPGESIESENYNPYDRPTRSPLFSQRNSRTANTKRVNTNEKSKLSKILSTSGKIAVGAYGLTSAAAVSTYHFLADKDKAPRKAFSYIKSRPVVSETAQLVKRNPKKTVGLIALAGFSAYAIMSDPWVSKKLGRGVNHKNSTAVTSNTLERKIDYFAASPLDTSSTLARGLVTLLTSDEKTTISQGTRKYAVNQPRTEENVLKERQIESIRYHNIGNETFVPQKIPAGYKVMLSSGIEPQNVLPFYETSQKSMIQILKDDGSITFDGESFFYVLVKKGVPNWELDQDSTIDEARVMSDHQFNKGNVAKVVIPNYTINTLRDLDNSQIYFATSNFNGVVEMGDERTTPTAYLVRNPQSKKLMPSRVFDYNTMNVGAEGAVYARLPGKLVKN